METRAWICVLAVLLLFGLAILPAGADSPDAAPADHHVAIRQAHLALASLQRDAEMNAALAYTGTRYNTDTGKMASLLAGFRAAEARIPAAATDAEIDAIIADLKGTALQFRDETRAQMSAGQGSWDDLGGQVFKATANNPYIAEKENQYWSTRTSGQLQDFDTWAASAQNDLDALKAKGFDTTKAQRALDVLMAKRPDLKSALEAKSESRVADAGSEILALSEDYGARFGETGRQVPDDARLRFQLDEGGRIAQKAGRLNADATVAILNIGAADPVLDQLEKDLTATRRLLDAGRLETARKNMVHVKKDYTDLAQAYRDIATTADLPPSLASALKSMAISLDNTASGVEVS